MNDEGFTPDWERLQKRPRYENKKYLKWVKTQLCVVCDAPADEAHHAIALGLGGMGTKAPDWAVMPACRICHSGIHLQSHFKADQWRWIAKTLGKAIEEGVI